MGLRTVRVVTITSLLWLLVSVCAVLYVIIYPADIGTEVKMAALRQEYVLREASLSKEVSELEAALKGEAASSEQRRLQLQLQRARDALESAEARISSAHGDYSRRSQEHERMKEEMASELTRLKNTLASGDPESSKSKELITCQDHVQRAGLAYNKLELQVADLKTLRPNSFTSVATTPELQAVYVSSPIEKTTGNRLMVEQLVSSLLATQRDSTSPFIIRVETGEKHSSPWANPVEECGKSGGIEGNRPRFFVWMGPNTVVFDGWLRDITRCISSTNKGGNVISVCCIMIITDSGEHVCDEGFFAARCDSPVLQAISTFLVDSSSTVRTAFNAALQGLGDRVKYLPLSEYRHHMGHAAGVVTSFDVRTLLKVYRTSSNDGSDNEVLDRLLRMRARALEEKFNEVESDTRNRARVRPGARGGCEITLAATHTLNKESMGPPDGLRPQGDPQIDGRSVWTALRSPQGTEGPGLDCHEVIGPMPSYGKDVEDELTLWLNQRYYSDPLPSDHPVAVRPEWRSAIQSLSPSSNALRDVQGMALAKDELLIRRYSPLLENPSVKPLLVSGSSIDPFLGFVYVAMTRSASENAAIEESLHRIREDFIASGRLPFGDGEDLVKRELESTERAAELEKMYREQQKEQNKHEQRRIEFP